MRVWIIYFPLLVCLSFSSSSSSSPSSFNFFSFPCSITLPASLILFPLVSFTIFLIRPCFLQHLDNFFLANAGWFLHGFGSGLLSSSVLVFLSLDILSVCHYHFLFCITCFLLFSSASKSFWGSLFFLILAVSKSRP